MATRPSAVDDFEPEPVELLGPRIRSRRLQLGVTLRALAERTGISSSALSQIETGRSLPSIARLYTIVEHLDTTIDRLLLPIGPGGRPFGADHEVTSVLKGLDGHTKQKSLPPGDSPVLVEYVPRAGQPNFTLRSGELWQRLGAWSMAGIDILKISYPDVRSETESEYVSHPGREFNYVVSGRLQIEVAEARYTLLEGDSLTFDASVRHRVTNLGPGKCETFCVFSDLDRPSEPWLAPRH